MVGIASLPALKSGLSLHEKEALQEIIPLAEDFAMHGDAKAADALEWMRGLLDTNQEGSTDGL